MFELAALSTFLDIFQKAFGLIDKHKDQKRRLFTDIVDPIYTELTPVVGEYYEFFRGCRNAFSEADVSGWEKILREKRKQREEIIMARNKILGITYPFFEASRFADRENRQEVDELLYHFVRALHGFFYASDNLAGRSEATSLFKYIDDVLKAHNMPGRSGSSFYIKESDLKSDAIEHIERSLQDMEWKWRAISGVYGKLRIYCLA